jgi:hypothetical protein
MEPLDEKELSPLLRQWEAPQAPHSLQWRVLPRPVSPWRWLLTGSIRIPVPVGVAAAVVFALWLLVGNTPPAPVAQPPASISLSDFQAVHQLEPTILGSVGERSEEGTKEGNDENRQLK